MHCDEDGFLVFDEIEAWRAGLVGIFGTEGVDSAPRLCPRCLDPWWDRPASLRDNPKDLVDREDLAELE